MTTLEQLRHHQLKYEDMLERDWDPADEQCLVRAWRETIRDITKIERRVGIRRISFGCTWCDLDFNVRQHQCCVKSVPVQAKRRTRIMTDRGLDRLLTDIDLQTEVQGGTSEIRGRESQHNAGLGAAPSSPRAAFLGKGRIMREKCKRVLVWAAVAVVLFGLGVATVVFTGCNTVSGFGVDLTRGAEGLSVDPAVRRAAPRR